MAVVFEDYSIKVKDALKSAAIAYLHEACGEVESQTKQNSKVVTGKTKGSYGYKVDESRLEGYIGSNYDNAIWEELGTGEYAANGDGRKGGWAYIDEKGKRHFTRGKKARHPMLKAYTVKKGILKRLAEEKIGSLT